MKHLYAPWRSAYDSKSKSTKSKTCPFCHHEKKARTDQYVIAHFQECFVLLNLFPYNPGHLMVIPYRHVAALNQLTSSERAEIMEVTALSTTILKRIFKTSGFNIGINLGGKAAGGSIPRHLHVHVLPRWAGDTGFLTTLADTKQISADLAKLCETLRIAFSKVKK